MGSSSLQFSPKWLDPQSWFQILDFYWKKIQCCGSGSGIRCLLDPWIRDPQWVFSGSRIRIPDPTITSESLRTIIVGVKILQFRADFLKYFSVHMGAKVVLMKVVFTKVVPTKVVLTKPVHKKVVRTKLYFVGRKLNRFKKKNLISSCLVGSGIRDPGSGMGKNPDPGSGINIPDPQHWKNLIFFIIFFISYFRQTSEPWWASAIIEALTGTTFIMPR